MKNNAIRQANMLVNWLEANNKTVTDVNVNIVVKDKNNEMYIDVMSDGSITKSDDSTSSASSFGSATECIKSISTMKKDSLPNESSFLIIINTKDFMKHHKGKLDIVELQDYFNDYIVKSADDDKIKLLYIGNISEEPKTVAVDFINRYGFNPIDVKKI